MSIVPSAMPFHTEDEPIRNHGSTDSSFDAAPSPTGPTIWSPGTSTSGTSSGPDWLPRRPSASQSDGCACASSPSMTKTERSSYPEKSGLVVWTT
jgi:hypothetical protein